MTPPQTYDPVTLNHWLWWKVKCFEASGEEFQRLFEEVMVRTDAAFSGIRPYGNSGDKKSDGILLVGDTLYQVYSPDEFTQAALKKKVREDLDGAVDKWSAMKKWVFVYNVRRGLPPDVGIELQSGKERHSHVELGHMSSDHLWDRLRGLELQRRAEVLGAPNGYEDFLLAKGLPDEKLATNGRFVLIHDVLSPIDQVAAVQALRSGGCEVFGPPIRLKPSLETGWKAADEFQRAMLEETISRSEHLRPRFAMFSLSPIALAIHAGFVISDRIGIDVFQWDRDRNAWDWNLARMGKVEVTGIPTETVDHEELLVRISVSAPVSLEDCTAVVGEKCLAVELSADQPGVGWLQHSEQIRDVAARFREMLEELRARAPRLRRIHIMAAMPTGIAVAIGRTINPRMNPPVALYEYSYNRSPKYEHVLTLQ